MDVDTASYTIAQRFVADGNLPDPASVRVEEWVNSFDQDYPAPEEGTFAVHIDGAPTPFLDQREVLLRVGIKARDSSERTRPDAALTFVIDTSGSMAQEDRLELVKDSLRKLVHGLGRGDSIAVVTFGDDARVVLPPTRATDEETIIVGHRRARAGRLDQPRGRPPARLRARPRDPSRRAASTASSSPRMASPTSA